MRWEKLYFKEIFRFHYLNQIVKANFEILIFIYILLYVFHWVFFNEENTFESIFFHIYLVLTAISGYFFMKADSGEMQRRSLGKDRDTNLISSILDIIGKKSKLICN